MNIKQDEVKLYYHQVLTTWEGFCVLHRELYELTCDEYLTLLASDIDKLEEMLPLKEEIIKKIGELERERSILIDTINTTKIFSNKITKSSELIDAFAAEDNLNSLPALKNLNALLIDIIERIQLQNKKNQIFLNKAMISLRDLKQGFGNNKAFTTYGADGMTRAISR